MIHIRTMGEVDKLRQCGKLNADVHEHIRQQLEAGITTRELDHLASQVIHAAGAKSSIYDPMGFPANICISVNDEIGHGVPCDYPIQPRDVVKVDVSVQYEGYHTDCAISYIVGDGFPEAIRLLDATSKALNEGIDCATPGRRCSDISFFIHKTIEQAGYSVIRHAFGHGVGTDLHEAPIIANFGPPHLGPKLRPGMVIAIEPVVSAGSRLTYRKPNGWTDVTIDGSLSAHFEHTVLVTEGGPEVLTQGLKSENELIGDGGPAVFYRDMEQADRAQLIQLAAQEMDPVLIAAWGRRVDPRDLFPSNTRAVVLKHPRDGTVGFFVFSELDDALHLNTLVIKGTHQGQGLGQQAMRYLSKMARDHDLTKVSLCVQNNNHRAIQFYKKLGFKQQGMPYVNTLQMTKDCLPRS